MRIFDDENGKMNLAFTTSRRCDFIYFTVYVIRKLQKGNRPSFDGAGKPEHAKAMYLYFNKVLRRYGLQVEEGYLCRQI